MVRRIVKGAVVGLSIAVAWTGAAPAPALAQDTPTPAFVPAPPDHQPGSSEYVPGSEKEPRPVVPDDGLPGFLTLDRVGTSAHAGIQMGFHKVDDVSLSDGFLMRFNPYGQFMFPNRKAGIYGQLPISHAFDSDGPDGTGVGNLELGGLFLPMSDSRLILRAGLALATASDDDPLDVGANVATVFERLTDFALVIPEYTTLRLSASTVHQMDMFFFRADGGFDLVIARPGTDDGDPSVFFRANVAGGIRTQFVDFSLEFANLAFVNGDLDDDDERFLHTAAIGGRTRGENQFHFGAVFPLDEPIRGEIWILSLGYMRAFN